ncbi:MAG: hypothetical protein ING44_09005 [Telmatospirillum sp.]|nr:hypothetical protein [Telmatospirillum sp.]
MRAVEVLKDIVSTIGEIDAAQIACKGGKPVDLIGLDGRVRELCLSTSALPRAEGLACAGALDNLVQALDRLQQALLAFTRRAQPAQGLCP